tara:strand:+ start:984 stop:1421 length:438 start_codon:yes stop_codon:yes gene_type:complete
VRAVGHAGVDAPPAASDARETAPRCGAGPVPLLRDDGKKISAEENFDGSVGRTSHQICHAQLSLHSRQKVGRFESNVSRISTPPTPARTDARTLSKMGVDIETLKPGDGVTFPMPGQVVTAHYTGAHRDASREKVKPAHGGMSAC